MPTDLSRKRFKPARNYSGVVMQQGKVQLDSDWNEQVELVDRRLRAESVDTLGRAAVSPQTPDAFAITPAGGSLEIGPGRMYVDGLLAENHGAPPQMLDEVLGEDRGTQALLYEAQPYLPEAPELPDEPGTYLVYLEVWQREVSYLEQPDLVEQAVGVDTTCRYQTVWQVKLLRDEDGNPVDLGEGVSCATPDDQLPGWEELTAPSDGRLSSGAVDLPDPTDPCLLPPVDGYKGLENRLYRVEIHDAGIPGDATWKWSRDNAVVASNVTAIPTLDTLVVDSIGRDAVLCFRAGDWVEITDHVLELAGEPGLMARIKQVDPARRTIELENDLPAGLFPTDDLDPDRPTCPKRHTRVRRWDQQGEVRDSNGNILADLDAASSTGLIPVPPAGTSVVLEKGVQITFHTPNAGRLRSGDYWVMAARTAKASVEKLHEAPPVAIHRHYCRLAMLHQGSGEDDTWAEDCRPDTSGGCCCTVVVQPGQDVQAAIDRVPEAGGQVCLDVGVHYLRTPLLIDGRENLTITGCGPGSTLVFDPPNREADAPAVVIAGASHDIVIEKLCCWADHQGPLVFADEDSGAVAVREVVLLHAGEQGDGVVLGRCCEVQVDASILVAGRGVVQADAELLAKLAALTDALRPEPVEVPGMMVPPPAPALPETLCGLRVADNDILAVRAGVVLGDVLRGSIAGNRIRACDKDLAGLLQRPDEEAGEVTQGPFTPRGREPGGRVPGGREPGGRIRAEVDERESFFARLYELVAKLPGLEQAGATLGQLGSGIVACMLDELVLRDNRIWAQVGIAVGIGRDLRAVDNRVWARSMGILVEYGLDLAVDRGSIRVTPGSANIQGAPPPAPGICVGVACGVAITGTRVRAPEGIVGYRQDRQHLLPKGCPSDHLSSLPRLLRIEPLWRAVLELSWLLYQAYLLLNQPEQGDEEFDRQQLESRLLAMLVELLGNRIVRSLYGRVEISGNHLQCHRYGVLLEQIIPLGGLHIRDNRVSGFSLTGIRVHPRFSVGLPGAMARWLRCVQELLIGLLRRLRAALARFLDGNEIPTQDPDTATIGAVLISGFLTLCARLHRAAGGDQTTRPPVLQLKEALDALDLAGSTWLDDLVNQSYRIDDNTLEGSGTGIWAGIDGFRVNGNRVCIHASNPVAFEAHRIGRVLNVLTQRWTILSQQGQAQLGLVPALLELAPDRLQLIASQPPEEWHDSQQMVVDLAAALAEQEVVSAGSPLEEPFQQLQRVVEAGQEYEISVAWVRFLQAISKNLNGYGIVLVGADLHCLDNRVTALKACPGLSRDAATGEVFRVPFTRSALGGIWHLANRWLVQRERQNLVAGGEARASELVFAALLAQALSQRSHARLEIAGNQVVGALLRGIRTETAWGLSELDVHDNHVQDAAWAGISFQSQDPGYLETVRIRGNTVNRCDGVTDLVIATGQTYGAQGSPPWLIQVDSAGCHGNLTALLSHNHGSAEQMTTASSAVAVWARVAAVTGNHILSQGSASFTVYAVSGLFDDNLMTQPVSVQGLETGLNVTL